MPKHLLEETVGKLDDAFNRCDLEALLNFYDDDAVLLLESGRRVQGKARIGEVFRALFRLKGTASQIKMNVIEAGELALYTSEWRFLARAPDGSAISRNAVATAVFRKQADGAWKCVLDSPFGPAVLK
jgi:uncharacterized protein (TIGR02246 family)